MKLNELKTLTHMPSAAVAGRLNRLLVLAIGSTLSLSLVPLAHSQVAGAGGGGGAAAAAAPAAAATTGTSTSTTTTGESQATRLARETNTDQNDHRTEVPAGSQDTRTEFQQMVEATTGRHLPIFGEDLFAGTPSTFAPINDVPVSPGYILGPGDELFLQMTGQVNQQMEFVVDRTGSINIPGLGPIHVAGLTFGELTPFLTGQLGKLYRNFTLTSRLGSLRSIQVFITGQARRPGSYTISSLSTLLNAIFVSGGVLPQGSLRDIQVIRNGQVIIHFDLYDLLLHGNKTKDIALVTGDVIYVPDVHAQVAVIGSINNAAIYELNGPTTVDQAIKLAGGETNVAAGATVRLERIFNHSERSLEDEPNHGMGVPLQSGDIISVTSVIDRFRNAVTLRGNVANPGRYVWHPGMKISDLIPNKESLVTRNYWRKRNLLGQIPQDYQPDTNPVVAEGALQASGNAIDKQSSNTAAKGTATGNPGGNSVGAALTGNNSAFAAKTDVILSAPDIYWNYAVIERQSAKDLTTSLIPFNLGSIVLDGKPDQNYELLPGDVVTIFSKSDLRVPSSEQTRYVRLEGEFNAVGVYSVQPGETLRSLIRRAGGFTQDAYLYASEFTRESTRRVEEQRLHEYADELDAQISSVTSSNQARAVTASDQIAANASAADARAAVARLRQITPIGRIVLDLTPNSQGIDTIPDISLEDGDRFVVPRVPANVNVQGQVYNANAFVFTPDQHVIDYLRRAGGPDRQADKKRTFVLRADGSVISRQYNNVNKSDIYPGDTIVVPPIIDRRAIFQRFVDIATIISGIGITALTLDIIARQ